MRALEQLCQPPGPHCPLFLRDHRPRVGGGRGLHDGLGEEGPGPRGQQVEGHASAAGGFWNQDEKNQNAK